MPRLCQCDAAIFVALDAASSSTHKIGDFERHITNGAAVVGFPLGGRSTMCDALFKYARLVTKTVLPPKIAKGTCASVQL
jgi:hypothetical protein